MEIWRTRIGAYFPGLHRARSAMAAITLQNRRPGDCTPPLGLWYDFCCTAAYGQAAVDVFD